MGLTADEQVARDRRKPRPWGLREMLWGSPDALLPDMLQQVEEGAQDGAGMVTKTGATHPALADLKRAKAESDRGNYRAKHQILSDLLDRHPGEFVQDSAQGHMIGLTHTPTSFKIHAPAEVVRGRAPAQPLYHGSPTADIKQLEPRPSHVLGGEKAVFGTPDRDLAIASLRPWHDADFEQGYLNGKPRMREQYPGAFDKIYGGKPGTLYRLPGGGFAPDPRLMRVERISREPVTPEASEHFPDALAALRGTRFKLHPYRAKEAAARANIATMPDGRVIDIGELIAIAKNRRVEKIPIDDVPRPSKAKTTGYSKKRQAKVDMDKPVVVGRDGTLYDGRHRLFRHFEEDKSHIRAVRVSEEDVDAATICEDDCKPQGDKIDENRIEMLPAKAAASKEASHDGKAQRTDPGAGRRAGGIAGAEAGVSPGVLRLRDGRDGGPRTGTPSGVGPQGSRTAAQRNDRQDLHHPVPEVRKQAGLCGAHDQLDRGIRPGEPVGVLQPAHVPLLREGLQAIVRGSDPAAKLAAFFPGLNKQARTADESEVRRIVKAIPKADLYGAWYSAVQNKARVSLGDWSETGSRLVQRALASVLGEENVEVEAEIGPPAEAGWTKLADLLPWVDLQPQQKRVAKRVGDGENLLVYHGLGSGKSLAGIAAAEGVGGPYTAIVPASLRPNYEGEISKFTDRDIAVGGHVLHGRRHGQAAQDGRPIR